MSDANSAVYQFTIPGKLPGLNEFLAAGRSRFGSNRAKRAAEAQIQPHLPPPTTKEINYPVWFNITWFEPSNRRDEDNVCFSVKVVFDAMVKAGLLANDNRRHIKGHTPIVKTDKDNPRIEVTVFECDAAW